MNEEVGRELFDNCKYMRKSNVKGVYVCSKEDFKANIEETREMIEYLFMIGCEIEILNFIEILERMTEEN